MTNDIDKSDLELEKPDLVYQAPTLRLLQVYEIASGDTNVPESNNGLLES